MQPTTKQILRLLQRFESRNVTFIDPDGSWPIVWSRANGTSVWDAEGRKYLDLTAAFGVAAAGHANPRVVRAGCVQMKRLLHAMGDVHPHALKAALAARLSALTFERWSRKQSASTGRRLEGKVIFCNSGFEAVEAALKTAILVTGRREVIAFKGAYHGLGYGALNVTHRAHFREPFQRQLAGFGHFLDFPTETTSLTRLEQRLEDVMGRNAIGAVLVEPIQTRGGIHVPPPGFLPLLRRLCAEMGALLVSTTIPIRPHRELVGLRTRRGGSGHHLPRQSADGRVSLSVCVGNAVLMDRAWPPSHGEAIHTSTFLGHPVGCAMALAQINEINTRRLPKRAREIGRLLRNILADLKAPDGFSFRVKGMGLLVGLEITTKSGRPATEKALSLLKGMLREGMILLPEGEAANVLAFTPPLTITEKEVKKAGAVLKRLLTLS
ncbi:MAG: aminotransferase class III-fold pyridoxal phosphate-dependent enzyme [Verrucomicrobiota bacterium]